MVIPPRIKTGPWIVLVVLTFGLFMINLDATIVQVAIPRMEAGLNTSFDQVLWVMNGYILAYAVLLITAAWAICSDPSGSTSLALPYSPLPQAPAVSLRTARN